MPHTVAPHSIEIARPGEPTAKPTNIFLFAKAEQGLQSKLYHLALCPQPGRAQRLNHEAIVYYNIDPHNMYPMARAYISDAGQPC